MSPRFRFPRPATYGRQELMADLMAGLTVGVLLVPQAMAYGLLAGVPPVYGLYAALVPLIGYALLASTPHTSVGPTALASLLCLNGITGMAEVGSESFIRYAILLGGLTGLLQLLIGVLRLGGIANLLSRPVLSGFVSAAAVLITFSQLDALLGIDAPRTRHFHETLLALGHHLPGLHWPSALLGLLTLAFLTLAGRVLPRKFPAMLVLIVLFTVLVGTLGRDWGVDVVGEVPGGLPSFSVPAFTWVEVLSLLPVAAVIALLSFIETLSIGKAFAPRYDYYRFDPNREAVALGVGKLLGSLFQAIPSSASFSRSAVGEGAGAVSGLQSLFAAALLILTLTLLTPWFTYLPIPVLAALIIYSIRNLFDWKEMRRLWRLAPKECATMLITFVFTLFAGLQYGVAGGVSLSLYYVLARAAQPHVAELGRIPGTNSFRNVLRFPNVEVDPSILIVRFDAELYFGNAENFRSRLEGMIAARSGQLRVVIIDGHTIHDVDTTGLFMLNQVVDRLDRDGVKLYLCGMIGPVRDMLYHAGLMERLGVNNFFLSIQDALQHVEEERADRDWGRPAVQHR